ncbi:MAG TPA: PilX N-terminal domain-containing pilus assembly protein [Candidatus Saccharimonadales bacterium]
MPKLTNTRQLSGNERGFASIVIALTLIIVLALLTVGFAQLARREQQTALNKQLANQAYYAAESGIQDAVQDINNGVICSNAITPLTCPVTTADPDHCMNVPGGLTFHPTVGANGATYSCLLVDLTPKSLVIDKTPPNSGENLYFSTTSPNPLDQLTIQWGSSNSGHKSFQGSIPAAGSEFPPQANWPNGGGPLLLFSLTQVGAAGSISRANLISNTFNTFLYPAQSGTSSVAFASAQGQVISGDCDPTSASAYPCSATITGLNGHGSDYVMHFNNYYDDVNVYVTGKDTGGNDVTFTGQDKIDVTGKDHNVLKRLEVRMKADGSDGKIIPDNLESNQAVQSQDLCKRLQTRPATFDSGPNTDFISPTTGSDVNTSTTDPCNLSN